MSGSFAGAVYETQNPSDDHRLIGMLSWFEYLKRLKDIRKHSFQSKPEIYLNIIRDISCFIECGKCIIKKWCPLCNSFVPLVVKEKSHLMYSTFSHPENQNFICFRGYPEAVVNAAPDDPYNFVVAVKDPGFFLLGQGKLFIDEEITDFLKS
jgi:hypothetical protein